MAKPIETDKFSPEETRLRVEAAIRGARITGHKPMKPSASKRKRKSKSKKPCD